MSCRKPYNTLFVGRLSYDTSEKKLRREFEQYGPIRRIRVVNDSITGKPRGYAFIEFEKPEDVTVAYKKADGKKLDDRRIVVDVERGRYIPIEYCVVSSKGFILMVWFLCFL